MESPKKIGVYVAHDDDAILGVGGKIAWHKSMGDDVYVVVCTDGKMSHKAVLRTDKPSPREVGNKRELEMKNAMLVFGDIRLYFLRLADGEGKSWKDKGSVKRLMIEITNQEKPDVVYFHYPDAHIDHRAVAKIMTEILGELAWRPKTFQFFIWTKDLAKGRAEVNARLVPDIPINVLKVCVEEEQLALKCLALWQMRSQVDVWPYADWPIQERSILDKYFLAYFLRGEEILIEVKS